MTPDVNTRATAALRALGFEFRAGQTIITKKRGRGTMLPDGGVWVSDAKSRWVPPLPGDVLDLSDAVTAASLLVLVREAWGDPEWHMVPDNTGCGWWSESVQSDALRLMYGTEVEALVAALEAKARESICIEVDEAQDLGVIIAEMTDVMTADWEGLPAQVGAMMQSNYQET